MEFAIQTQIDLTWPDAIIAKPDSELIGYNEYTTR